MAARFEINCTDVFGLACKGAAILLEINKPVMKTKNIRKSVRKICVTNVYKKLGLSGIGHWFVFSSCEKKKKKKKIQSAYFWQLVGKLETELFKAKSSNQADHSHELSSLIFLEKNNKKTNTIFENIVCYNFARHFKGPDVHILKQLCSYTRVVCSWIQKQVMKWVDGIYSNQGDKLLVGSHYLYKQLNLNGSNIFGTVEICSRYG